MLSDRSYMRGAKTEPGTSALVWLISSLVAAFIMEVFFKTIGVRPGAELTSQTALTISGLQNLRVWTILTHAWFHSTENLLHVITVVAGVALLGRELIPRIGSKQFLTIFGCAILLGAITWSAINWHRGGVLMGASAGVFGLVSFLAFSRPQLELNFLLFFFLPISIRLKTLLYSLATLSIGASAFYEVYGATAPFPYAPSAHLGGLIAGWLCFCFFNRQSSVALPPDLFSDVDSDEPETSAPSAANVAVVSATAKRQAVRAEIDRILDKINSTGLKSLTPAERQILDQAKNHLPGN